MYGWHNKKTILAKRKHCCVMYTCYRLQPYWDYHCCAMIEQYIANKLAVLSQFVCLQCFVNRALSKYRNLSFSWNVHNRKETHNNIVSVIGRFTMMLRICAASGGGGQMGQFSLNCPICQPPLSRVYVILIFTQAAEYGTRVEYRHYSFLTIQF
jgi:hypothetical protein